MSDFTLKHERCEAVYDYAVQHDEMENGSEQTRVLHEEILAGWRFQSPALTKAQAEVHKAFFDSKYGSGISFTWTEPRSETEYTVRYVDGSFKIVDEGGYSRVEWEFKRVF